MNNQFAVIVEVQKEGEETSVLVDYAMHLAFYAALTAIFLMVIALVVKLMWNCDGEDASSPTRANENSRLFLSKEEVAVGYGTNEKDLESGSSSSSDDELYDGKICVICYDDQRNCFFIPCGHCVTCHTCAHRIIKEKSKCCPICRGIIDKIRRLHIL
ncbi:putative E3 ubiquitin ligase [Handroanthus impetiginosus]|uniref:Putative E3 ubiquitin ligase n=1 Tax=Handroanthus impetiginosus TaxID=429701 RepID=A0A2G9HLJ7_9LAMI|nr:putative E3 ubiquitin ligase [Handroanthus impetiginosus]